MKEPWAYLEALCVTRQAVYVCGGQNDMTLFGICELHNRTRMVVGKHGLIAIQNEQQLLATAERRLDRWHTWHVTEI